MISSPPNHLYNINNNNNTLSFSLLYLHTDISPFQTMSAANHRLLFIIYHWVCTSHLKGKDDPLLIVDYCHYTDAMMLNSSRYHQNYDKTINKIIYFMLSFEPDTWQVHSPPSGGGSSLKPPPPPSPSTTVAWWKKKLSAQSATMHFWNSFLSTGPFLLAVKKVGGQSPSY